jgi:hypothetical protein
VRPDERTMKRLGIVSPRGIVAPCTVICCAGA